MKLDNGRCRRYVTLLCQRPIVMCALSAILVANGLEDQVGKRFNASPSLLADEILAAPCSSAYALL